jgi:hypothetical protein
MLLIFVAFANADIYVYAMIAFATKAGGPSLYVVARWQFTSFHLAAVFHFVVPPSCVYV